MSVTVWVTGANGFIGRHLCRRLVINGERVVGLGNDVSQCDVNLLGRIEGIISDWAFDQALAKYGAPKVIFHLAGGSSVALSITDPNAEAIKTLGAGASLIAWIKRNAPEVNLVFASSAAVYGADHAGAIRECGITNPLSPYGVHKLAVERQIITAGLDWGLRSAIVRLFSLYGPGLRRQILWDIATRIEMGNDDLQLMGSGNECRDFLQINDCVNLLTILVNHTSSNSTIVNGASGVSRSIYSVASELCQHATKEIRVKFTGATREGDPKCLVADISKSELLGFSPTVCWEDGVRDYMNWIRRGACARGI